MSKLSLAGLVMLAACADAPMTPSAPRGMSAPQMAAGAGSMPMPRAGSAPSSGMPGNMPAANPAPNANGGQAGMAGSMTPVDKPATAGSSSMAGSAAPAAGAGGSSQPPQAGSDEPDPFDPFDPFPTDPADPADPNDPFGTGPDEVVPGYEPHPDNPPECPKAAPEDPIGSCIGVPVYAVCAYGPTYTCLCDWVHWLCAG